MYHLFTKRIAVALACSSLFAFASSAKTGAPHTLKADVNFNNMVLNWCSPTEVKELKWHDGRDYNGDTAPVQDIQKSNHTYVAAKFTATDLKNVAGEKIEAIKFFQYRQAISTTVMVYENGKVVAQADGDMSLYEKNTTQTAKLPQAVEIKPNCEYLFAVRFEAGSNTDFVAIKDSSCDAPGKGDLISSDGKNWTAAGGGDYLITAILANDCDEEPTGYNVYRNDTKVNSEAITDKSIEIKDMPIGTANYTVSAVYSGNELKSAPVEINSISFKSLLPSPTFSSATVDGLNVKLEWIKPLLGGNELTWSNKTKGISIGGSASSNTKVWVRNDFDATDLAAFSGGKITAVNYLFAEAVISGVTVFITKDGAIDYSEEMNADAIAAIAADKWVKFSLKTPYQLEDGHAYGYGLYVLHTPKAHPMAVDNGETVDVKGNSFSTSSPASKGFNTTKPSWKTLKSGGMEGNWMMTADITGASSPIADLKYDIYRDGEQIAKEISTTSYDDEVSELGKYTYSIISRSGDRSSFAAEKQVNVKLPSAYSAPLIEGYEFDNNSKKFDIVWNMDKELSHCGEATYRAGFDEEMALMWGTQFSAAELAAYKGYYISKIKFIIGEEIGDITLGVYTTKGVALSSIEIPGGTLKEQAVYTIKLPKAVEITGNEDLIIAYSGTLPAKSSPIIIDGGPLVDGGAKVSLTNGASWLNLSTLNPSFGNYNIYISAMASEKVSDAPAKAVELKNCNISSSMVVSADTEYEIGHTGNMPSRAATRSSEAPKVKSFNIYRNGELVGETTDYEYAETVTRFAPMSYYITTVYTNGWESNPSETVSFTNRIEQKSLAPYGLEGEKSGNDLILKWQAPDKSTVLTYTPEGVQMMALKMTGGSTLNSHCVIKFTAEDLKEHIGETISRIQFGLGDPGLSGCSVIVMNGENIIYQQTVPVSTLVKGLNDVRLNEPVEIPANADMCVGYIATYSSSLPHPLGCFECTEHTGLGDIISSSGSQGYWYSLHTKFKQYYCWYIKATLSKADATITTQAVSRADAAQTTYNVYCDGTLLDNVSETGITIKNANDGKYYVTAVNADNESAESNSITIYTPAGIEEITNDDAAIVYDETSATIKIAQDAKIEVYATSGMEVASTYGNSLSIADLQHGVYIIRVTNGENVKAIRVIR